jgi:hypothetical protein
MYHIKIMKDGGKHEKYPCQHYAVQVITPDSPAVRHQFAIGGRAATPGVVLELTHGRAIRVIRLPEDGHTVYVENNEGKTIDTYRWPEERQEAAL